MILALFFCVVHNYKFVLCSKNANFGYDKGWRDYFEPFCEEWNSWLDNYPFNERSWEYKPGRRHLPILWLYQIRCRLLSVEYLTRDIMPILWNLDSNKVYSVESLNLHGNVENICRQINSIIWNFNVQTRNEIDNRISRFSKEFSFNGSDGYLAMHIRRGDKFGEISPIELDKYIETAKAHTSLRRCFVSSDDYTVFEELKKTYPNWKFYTMTRPNQRGYFQHDYEKNTAEWRYDNLMDFFASLEIMAKAELYVGTLSSNVGMFMYWRMPYGRCIGVDFEEWRIW